MGAFLDTIAFSEGTDKDADDGYSSGYDIVVGGGTFEHYASHPHILVNLPKLHIKSTAAGRYQIL